MFFIHLSTSSHNHVIDLMPASYLNTLRIEYDPRGVMPNPYGIPDDPVEREYQLDLAAKLSEVIGSMKLSMIFLSYALQAAKIEMRTPQVRTIWLNLSLQAEQTVNVSKGNLSIYREFDPIKLLEIPYDAESYGEFTINCWEWAANRLEAETDFPAEFVRDQMKKFRTKGYGITNTLKPQIIAGSKAKARIHGFVSCTQTVTKVEVSFRGQPLFERTIWDAPVQGFSVAYNRCEAIVEDGQFKVRGAAVDLMPEASFLLDSLPEQFLKTLV
jgi:hypothetical protein